MRAHDRESSGDGLIAALIAFNDAGRAVWPAVELESALRHQLRRSLAAFGHRDRKRGEEKLPTSNTLGDLLFREARPSLEVLRALKEFSKREGADPHAAVPPDVCLLLYYGSIVVARLKRNTRISRLSDDDLRRGFNWAARQPWADAPTRELFLIGLRYLRSPRARWRR